MSRSWPLAPLGEILTKSNDWIDLKPDETYREVTVRLWGKGIAQRRKATGAEIAAAKRLVIHTNQFILSRIDARNGAFGIVPNFLEGAIVSNDFPVFTPNPERVLPPFLGWMSKTFSFVDLCRAASEGTTNRVRLKEDRFLAMTIPLPSLSEQQRIVTRIEEVAAKIEEANSLRQKAVKESGGFISSLHLNLAQSRTVKLNEILKLDEDREYIQFGNRYPQVGVRGFGEGLFPKESVDVAETTYKVFNRLYDGAVVLSQVKGWEGAIAVCPPNLAGKYVSPEYRTFRCIEKMAIPKYIGALVSTSWFWTKLKDMTRGVGARRERTRPEQFLNMELPMPREDQQQEGDCQLLS